MGFDDYDDYKVVLYRNRPNGVGQTIGFRRLPCEDSGI